MAEARVRGTEIAEVCTTALAAFDGARIKDATFARRDFPQHFHDELSIGLVQSGRERLDLETLSCIVPAGAIVVLRPGHVHAHGAVDHEPWRYRALYVSPDAV